MFLPRTRGACLAHFRNMLRLTQTEISQELGINRSSISKMENDEINVSESVWNHVLRLIFDDFELEQSIPYREFRCTLEQFIEDENVSGGTTEWNEKRLSLQQETSI
jgi:transcriptional regulator with XRE-family HTH domain